MSDEVAQEFQVLSNGNANIEGPQVNFQNEISDPDECAKAANVTLPDRSCVGDSTYELGRPQYYVFDRGSEGLRVGEAHGSSSSADSFMPVAGQ